MPSFVVNLNSNGILRMYFSASEGRAFLNPHNSSPFWSKFIVLQGWKLRVDAPKIGVWASLSLIRASLEWINNEN